MQPGKNYYQYFANGLTVNSQIAFPELSEVQDNELKPDYSVIIEYGTVPDKPEDNIVITPFGEIASDCFFLNVSGVAKYYIDKSKKVIVEPYVGSSQNEIRLYILSTIFGVLIHKAGLLPLHASAIKHGNSAALVAGRSGIGKSTLALGLYKRGCEILNDDVSTVYIDDKEIPHVFTGYTHLKLWEESLEKYGYEKVQFRKLKKNAEKYSFPFLRRIDTNCLPIKAILFIQPTEETGSVSHTFLHGLMVFEFLRKNTFRYQVIKGLNLSKGHFELCSSLINKLPFVLLTRPVNYPAHEFAGYVDNVLKSL